MPQFYHFRLILVSTSIANPKLSVTSINSKEKENKVPKSEGRPYIWYRSFFKNRRHVYPLSDSQPCSIQKLLREK